MACMPIRRVVWSRKIALLDEPIRGKTMAYSRWSKSRVAVALLVTGYVALFSNQMWADAVSEPILPITIHKHFLEGQGLVVTEAESDEAISTESTINSSSHLFFEGKISASVFDVDPGKVRIDGLPYDE